VIPPTKHGLPALVCVSGLQKCIRRGMEREAMQFACELLHTSKSFLSMVCNRLELISHEDIDSLACPWIVPYVQTACEQAKAWYELPNPGKSRMAVGNAIRLMCRAPKSREGDHFQAAVGLGNLLADQVPDVPDWVYDMHTAQGKRLKRGLQHFREEGAKLIPTPADDVYIEECYRMWELRDHPKADGTLFDGASHS
jgi:replication-associated recombination protein RarA